MSDARLLIPNHFIDPTTRDFETRMALQKLSRREALTYLGAVSGLVLSNPWASFGGASRRACGQLAGKRIRWIVPFSPGGGYDTYSRMIEPFYESRIGADIVVDNAPGAAGLVGARTLQASLPNGLTLAILGASGLLVAALSRGVRAPNPARDFSILGRVMRNRQLWTTGSGSGFQTIEDVLTVASDRSILFGITEVGSANFVGIAVTSSLLGIEADFVAGFPGSRESSLAAIRGDVDLVSHTFDSVRDRIEAGQLRPLLQASTERISSHSSLNDVPLLGGDEGLAARRAAELGRDVQKAKADVESLSGVVGAGRLVAAPPGLEESLFRCLEENLYQALTDPAFEAAAARAGRSLDIARAAVARADIQVAEKEVERFIPIIREAIGKVRGHR